ncbi:MAG: hypothetical protein QOH63_915 [Acidobacteriota bacterium]|jgi:hypothetical protein|nr:hypothetical protein [Acidobacteriota bacterium]
MNKFDETQADLVYDRKRNSLPAFFSQWRLKRSATFNLR